MKTAGERSSNGLSLSAKLLGIDGGLWRVSIDLVCQSSLSTARIGKSFGGHFIRNLRDYPPVAGRRFGSDRSTLAGRETELANLDFGLRSFAGFSGWNHPRGPNRYLAAPFAAGRATTGEQLRTRSTDGLKVEGCKLLLALTSPAE